MYLQHIHGSGAGQGSRAHGNCLMGWLPNRAGNNNNVVTWTLDYKRLTADDTFTFQRVDMTVMQVVDPD